MVISATQLKKSTISANRFIRRILIPIVDYNSITPGEKRLIPCRIEAPTITLHTEAACIVPKRRSEIQTEPRVWPYRARECLDAGDELEWTVEGSVLVIRVVTGKQ